MGSNFDTNIFYSWHKKLFQLYQFIWNGNEKLFFYAAQWIYRAFPLLVSMQSACMAPNKTFVYDTCDIHEQHHLRHGKSILQTPSELFNFLERGVFNPPPPFRKASSIWGECYLINLNIFLIWIWEMLINCHISFIHLTSRQTYIS